MRLFFALPLDTDAKLAITHWRDKYCTPMNNWVPAANYHITLAFLGQIEERQLDSLLQEADALISKQAYPSEHLKLDQSGFWAKSGIFWVGPSQWPNELTKLASKLHQLGCRFGAKKETRSYQPHVTLARKCLTANKPLTEIELQLPTLTCCLYQSISGRQGVSYQAIHEWQLESIQPHTSSRPYRRKT